MKRKFSLAALLESTAKHVFFKRHWERRPLLVTTKNRRRFSTLLAMRDLDGLIHQIKDPHIAAFLRVVKRDGKGLGQKSVPKTESGNPDLPALYAAFSQGYTLVLNAVDQRWRTISMMSRELEEELGHRVGVNAYFTPAKSQGFLPHADDHDVLILQVDGAKDWKIYRPEVYLPLENQRPEVKVEALGRPILTARLKSGDVLYVPRGFIHEGSTEDAPSLHLTVGMHPFRWIDAMKEVLDLAAAENVELRRAIPGPIMSAKHLSALAQRRFEAHFREMAVMKPAAAVMARLRRRLLTDGSPSLEGHFESVAKAAQVRLATRLRRRVGPPCEVSATRTHATIRFAGNSVSGPVSIEPALRFMAGTQWFSASDLPGRMSGKSKLVLVRRLVSEGLLSMDSGRN